LRNDLKEGLKARRKIGGYVIEFVGLMSYSMTGARLRMN
jgi:hypothetical protein